MAEYEVIFQPSDISVRVPAGATVAEAGAAAGLTLLMPCGGRGRCGKCAVRVRSGGLCEVQPSERQIFGEREIAEGWRLACQARVTGEAEIEVPAASSVTAHRVQVEGIGREVLAEPNIRKLPLRLPPPSASDARDDLRRLLDALGGTVSAPACSRLLQDLPGLLRSTGYQVTAVVAGDSLMALEPHDTSDQCYGVAVDIGTTTVVAYLCHLPTGQVVGVASGLNPQARYGDDVISRLQYAISEDGGLERVASAIRESIDDLIGGAADEAGVPRECIYELTVVGNTCMTHLFLGVSPIGLASLPFSPAFREAQTTSAESLGIRINPAGLVYVVPNIGGFVGADTVGVILASELDEADGLRVAVDIGTNGEIVVARQGQLHSCSTAAGPAFEGARIGQGMRAASGAIDRVQVGEEVDYHVIGEAPATGLCGSGLVDAIAELARLGIVDESGRMRGREEVASLPEKVRERLVENDSGREFVIAPARPPRGKAVAVTARDVRELQLAKGAILAGIALLLDELDVEASEIEALLLAGAFGNYIRWESAVSIGLIPSLPQERIISIGNAAGVGARLVLCSTSLRRRAEEIARRVHHVELSQREGFYDRFAGAMAIRAMM